jgi:peptidoglycan biosynthesis protein MviN/MurJ (putative lipid II flippase)
MNVGFFEGYDRYIILSIFLNGFLELLLISMYKHSEAILVTIADYLSAAIMTLVASLVLYYYPIEDAEPFSFLMVLGVCVILFATYVYIMEQEK